MVALVRIAGAASSLRPWPLSSLTLQQRLEAWVLLVHLGCTLFRSSSLSSGGSWVQCSPIRPPTMA